MDLLVELIGEHWPTLVVILTVWAVVLTILLPLILVNEFLGVPSHGQ